MNLLVYNNSTKILIEFLSAYNYTFEGEEQLERKLKKSFENGTEVAWLIHTGAGIIGKGVQVMAGKYDAETPLLVGDSPIDDAGLGLSLTASHLLEEE